MGERLDRRFRRGALAAALTAALAVAGAATGSGAALAGQEPPLTVPPGVAASALHCTGNLQDSRQTPVLFLHGTTSDARANWSWNWDRALDARQWAHCDLDLPASGNGDIQYAAEYVVASIRSMAAGGHRPISMVGHSQGGMIGRWALKYWPDTRPLVEDYVGLSSSNHGTAAFSPQCPTVGCAAADWQQRAGSNFLTALNTGPETWPGISYTEISTHDDEVVVPSTSPYLTPGPGVTNVAVQDLCPTETVDHFGMAYDNAAWLIGLDALTHAGPAVLSRIPTSTCGQPLMPSVDPVTFPANAAAAMDQTATSSAEAPNLPAEPPLRCYVTDTCHP